MSKAEELSRQYVLPFLDNHYEKYGEHKQMEMSRFDGYDVMSAYKEGYYQAEKDLVNVSEETIKEVCEWLDNHTILSEKWYIKDLKKHFNNMK